MALSGFDSFLDTTHALRLDILPIMSLLSDPEYVPACICLDDEH
jgi:hypothetical protein